MLLIRIERFLRARQMPPTYVGREVLGDPCFVQDLRQGREPRPATVRRVAAYLDERDGKGE